LRVIIHLEMALESFTTAALVIYCVWCVTKEVGLARVRHHTVGTITAADAACIYMDIYMSVDFPCE